MERKDNQETILIVDDTPGNIVALQSLLEKSDRNFLNATNGSDALKLALSREVDLIMLDVQMANMDGFEVAQLLKSNNKTKDIPVIFVSAVRKEHIFIMKGFEEGAVDYLPKPLDPEITKAKVTMLLKLQQQRKELIEKNLSLEKSALLINNSADLLGVLDENSLIFEEINNAAGTILGYMPEEIKGISLLTLINQDSRALISGLKKEGEKAGGRLSFEIPISSKNGEIKWLQWKVIVKDKKWFVNARDITFQKSADDQIRQLNSDLQENLVRLEESNKDLDSFSYSVSHDLRAPLRSITAYVEALKEEKGSQLDEEGRKILESLKNNSKRMETLINDLLEFAKLGRREVRKRMIDTNQMIVNILRDLKDSIKDTLKVEVKNLLAVHADPSLLTQVFVNLVSNAIKYSGKKEAPEMEIGSYQEKDSIVFYVKDNGVGFNMEYAGKLFNVFQRLHSSKEFEGTGVGLSIVYRIIQKHGGRVWAEGKVDEGATFYFALPVS